MSDSYDASAITILKTVPIADAGFIAASALAVKYGAPISLVQRGLQACALAGRPDSRYFVDRYLEKLPVPFDAKVDEQYRQLLDEARR